MNKTDALAVITALEKEIARVKKEIRSSEDEALFQLYEKDGIQKRSLRFDGEDVGTMTITFSKAHADIVDKEAFNSFMIDNGMAHTVTETVTKTIYDGEWEKIAEKRADGSVGFIGIDATIPGLAWVDKAPKTTMVKVDNPAQILKQSIAGSTLAGLLEA